MKGGVPMATKEKIMLKKEIEGKTDYPDPMVDIIFKSMFRKDEKRYLIKTLMKEFFYVEVKEVEERDSHFVAKGKNKRGEACDYLIKVDRKLISIECNKGNDDRLQRRNYSHLKRTIAQANKEAVQIHFDNYDIGGKEKLVYSYSIRDEEGNEEPLYHNLIKIFHINLVALRKKMYNKDIKEFTKFEKVLLLFLVRTKENLALLVKEEGELEYMKEIIEEIASDEEIWDEYTNHELEIFGAVAEATKEAEEKEKEEMAKKFLKEKVDIHIISKCTGLSCDEIIQLGES